MNDYANYRKMQEPLASSDEANAALEKFFAAVEEARNECHIMDVHVIVKINVLTNGEEHAAFSSAHFGSELECAPMSAWSLGKEEERFKQIISKHLKG